ncbi:Probable linoleate 9S-lipoxygenase 5 [Linum grandiflorum]
MMIRSCFFRRNKEKQNDWRRVKGTVVLMKKSVLDLTDLNASIVDRLDELVGHRVSLQLISSVHGDPQNAKKGKVGKAAYLENWIPTIAPLTAGQTSYNITFDWDEEEIGIPGGFLIKNNHHTEFFLKSLTLQDVPGEGRMHFVCNSWVYPAKRYKTKTRVFFTNKTYLPHETPLPLVKYREDELVTLRGNGQGELQEWDRVYDYAFYNDLGDPDCSPKHARPTLGGSAEFPYPRRGRTGRPPAKSDTKAESRLPLLKSLEIYVPRDEKFGPLKLSDFLVTGLKSIIQLVKPELEDLFSKNPGEFDSFEDALKIYDGGVKLLEDPALVNLWKNVPLDIIKRIFHTNEELLLKYPLPEILKESRTAWRTDQEFAREMLAGLNPVIIRLLQEFPPKSKLDREVYGNQDSSITEEHIMNQLNGQTIVEAINNKKIFILDHHDKVMPYLRRINRTTNTKTYATRTILFLQNDETLKPLAIELSLPHPDGDQFGAVSKVYKPPAPPTDHQEGTLQDSIWQLAKAYVSVNDSCSHQLITHWLHTHAVIEPFVIATNRQLSVLHPIYKLLHPHLRDTMSINALGRQLIINGGGVVEATLYPAKYSMEMSSFLYKDWNFTEQDLPLDLKKRGMAVSDPDSKHGLRLVIKDYPYAVDGLEIWSAIKTWVSNYTLLYYPTDEVIQSDVELQSWWKELVEVGHGDKKDEPWWPKMQNVSDLIESCTTVIWIASALHAATNFGQYAYAGYMPNRPTTSRRLMPEEGSPEFEELKTNPERAFLRTITARLQTLLGISLIELLSTHSSDEVYLGQRDTAEWTADLEAVVAFEKFGKTLKEVEDGIMKRNNEKELKNRYGPVKIPYTLLFPSSEAGRTGKGIPNSITI